MIKIKSNINIMFLFASKINNSHFNNTKNSSNTSKKNTISLNIIILLSISLIELTWWVLKVFRIYGISDFYT